MNHHEMVLAPERYDVAERLRDGMTIRIRAIRADDRERLHENFAGLSQQSVYYRFMGFKRDLSPEELTRLTELDFKDHVGLVATIMGDGRELIIAVGRYVRGAEPRRAEIALAVLDDYQSHGIGRLLIEHLNYVARAGGITEFEANVAGDNVRALELFASIGLKVRRTLDSGIVHLYFSTGEPDDPAEENK